MGTEYKQKHSGTLKGSDVNDAVSQLQNSTPNSASVSGGGGDSAALQASILARFEDNQNTAAEREADRYASAVSGAKTPDEVKSQLGEAMGADFSDVEFHTGGEAESKSTAIGARAYTSGNDVYFGQGGFDPSIAAHELVHTVQQGSVEGTAPVTSVDAGSVQMFSLGGLFSGIGKVAKAFLGGSKGVADTVGGLVEKFTGSKGFGAALGSLAGNLVGPDEGEKKEGGEEAGEKASEAPADAPEEAKEAADGEKAQDKEDQDLVGKIIDVASGAYKAWRGANKTKDEEEAEAKKEEAAEPEAKAESEPAEEAVPKAKAKAKVKKAKKAEAKTEKAEEKKEEAEEAKEAADAVEGKSETADTEIKPDEVKDEVKKEEDTAEVSETPAEAAAEPEKTAEAEDAADSAEATKEEAKTETVEAAKEAAEDAKEEAQAENEPEAKKEAEEVAEAAEAEETKAEAAKEAAEDAKEEKAEEPKADEKKEDTAEEAKEEKAEEEKKEDDDKDLPILDRVVNKATGGKGIGGIANSVIGKFTDKKGLGDILGGITGSSGLGDFIGTAAKGLFGTDDAGGLVNKLFGDKSITDLASSAISGVGSLFGKVKGWFSGSKKEEKKEDDKNKPGIFSRMWSGIKGFFSGGKDEKTGEKKQSGISKLWGNIKSGVKSFFSGSTDEKTGKKTESGISKLWGKVKSGVSSIMTADNLSIAGDIFLKGLDSAKNIAQGIKDGNWAGPVLDSLKSVGGMANGFFKSKFNAKIPTQAFKIIDNLKVVLSGKDSEKNDALKKVASDAVSMITGKGDDEEEASKEKVEAATGEAPAAKEEPKPAEIEEAVKESVEETVEESAKDEAAPEEEASPAEAPAEDSGEEFKEAMEASKSEGGEEAPAELLDFVDPHADEEEEMNKPFERGSGEGGETDVAAIAQAAASKEEGSGQIGQLETIMEASSKEDHSAFIPQIQEMVNELAGEIEKLSGKDAGQLDILVKQQERLKAMLAKYK